MKIEQIYTGCLAQGAYYITSGNEAAIIDPLREVQPYIDRAKRDGVRIKYVFETHFHADFVSGHLDLSKKSGAQIIYGPTATPEFDAVIATDGQEFTIGKISIKALHTPGHTMESTTYLLRDEHGKNHAIFSGDTLFLGDVGRPDLAQKAADMTQEELAGILYDSLMNKIMPLADDVIVYPAHGAGSACGKHMMKETVDTLGHQKEVNYALRQPDRTSFIHAVTEGLLPPPAYFPLNVAMNKSGYASIDQVISRAMRAMDPLEFEQAAELTGAMLLDTRSASEFAHGFVPQSINIGIRGDFAPWVGALIGDVKQEILLITAPGKEEETVTRLARVGFDHVIGYLKGGFESWKSAGKETDTISVVSAEKFAHDFKAKKTIVLDVRRESEYAEQHLADAFSKPLAEINDWIHTIDPDQPCYIHCEGGYRSMIAASILQARGYRNLIEIRGGFSAIAKSGLPTSDFVSQNDSLPA